MLSVSSVSSLTDSAAVLAVDPIIGAVQGDTAELQVYAAADPPLASHEILWYQEGGMAIDTDKRLSLMDSNKRLLIHNVNMKDSGVYRVDIQRQITTLAIRILATTFVYLDVQGN